MKKTRTRTRRNRVTKKREEGKLKRGNTIEGVGRKEEKEEEQARDRTKRFWHERFVAKMKSGSSWTYRAAYLVCGSSLLCLPPFFNSCRSYHFLLFLFLPMSLLYHPPFSSPCFLYLPNSVLMSFISCLPYQSFPPILTSSVSFLLFSSLLCLHPVFIFLLSIHPPFLSSLSLFFIVLCVF